MKNIILTVFVIVIVSFNAFSGIYAPTLQLPKDNAVDITPNTTLDWKAVTGAYKYHLVLSTTIKNNQTGKDTTINVNYYQIYTSIKINALLFGQKYFWKVRTISDKDTSEWSKTFSFNTINTVSLLLPNNNAMNMNSPVIMEWDNIDGATSYDYEVDINPTFSSPFRSVTNVVSVYSSTNILTIVSIKDLLFSYKYYWRVCARNLNSISGWSETRNFTMLSNSKTYPTLINPPDLSINNNTSLTFRWYFLADATTYTLQVDTNNSFANPMISTTVKNNIYLYKQFKYGKDYYWRVRGIGTNNISSWSDVFKFTTVNQVNLNTPANGSTDQVFTNLILKWDSISGTSKYICQRDTAPLFNSTLFKTDTLTTFSLAVPTLLTNTKYYWRVKAINSVDTTIWSNIFNFTTKDAKITAPVLNSPKNNSSFNLTAPKLVWLAVAGVTKYRVQLDSTIAFSKPIYDNTTVNTNISAPTLKFNKVYYWRVKSIKDKDKDTSLWSTVFSFRTLDVLPAKPILISPITLSEVTALKVKLQWGAVSGATKYVLQLGQDADLTGVLLINDTNKLTEKLTDTLIFGNTYYWRVKALSTTDTSGWSEISSFSVLNIPQIVTPADLSVNNSVSGLKLKWRKILGVKTYTCEFDTSNAFNSTLLNSIQNLTDTTTVINNLLFNTKYYWRINASSTKSSVSAWSQVFSFNTLNSPQPILPADLSTNTLVSSINLKWAKISGASKYTCEVDTSPLFNTTLLKRFQDITDTSLAINNLLYNTNYYWRVNVQIVNGVVSDWSPVFNFKTITGIVTLATPKNSAQNITTQVRLFWSVIDGATEYDIEADTTVKFNTIFHTVDSSYGLTNAYLGSMLFNAKYFWKVRARNKFSTAQWSEIFSFNTIDKLDLISPLNGAVNQYPVPGLSFENVQGDVKYNYEIDNVPNFTSSKLIKGSSLNNILRSDTLYFGTKYYWRVQAQGSYNKSKMSDVWSFTTLDKLTLVSPVNGATNIKPTPSVTFKWNRISGVKNYELQYDKSSDFKFAKSETADGANESLTLSGLLSNTQYFWRLRAVNTNDTSQWSDAWSLTIAVGIDKIISSLKSFTVYPVPAKNKLHIDFNNSDVIDNFEVSVSNILGQSVLTSTILFEKGKNLKDIDISALESGIYTIRLKCDKFNLYRKFVKE